MLRKKIYIQGLGYNKESYKRNNGKRIEGKGKEELMVRWRLS